MTGRLQLYQQIKPLLTLSDIKRPWSLMLVSALAVGIPAIAGAWLGHFSLSLIACLGGLVILYLRQVNIGKNFLILSCCSFGFTVCFVLGLLTSFNPILSAATLALTVFLTTVGCRYFDVPAPGSFFFVVVACMARTLPFDAGLIPERSGILLFGCIGACLLALFYNSYRIYIVKEQPLESAEQQPDILPTVIISAVTAIIIGGGYLFALTVQLENPYWVAISAAAILQGASLRAVWHRNIHRMVGTTIGIGIAWVIFSFSPNEWVLAGLIVILCFCIETLITRNYGMAVIFITPLTLILADSTLASLDTNQLMITRLADIVLGSFIGLLGGWILHHQRFQSFLKQRFDNELIR